MKQISEEDYQKLLKYKERERAELIDNLYRARIIKDYNNVKYSTEELAEMWKNY